MKVTLEQVDELRKRAHVSFEDAKEALEMFEGDLVEALVYLEKNKKFKGQKCCSEDSSILDKIKGLIKKGNEIRFIIKKKERRVLDLSLNVFILIAVFAFHVTAVALVIALLAGYKLKFENCKGEGMKVNETLDKVHDNIDNFKKKMAEDDLN